MIVAVEILVSALTFLLLVGASLGCLLWHVRLSPKQLQEDTNTTVRNVANIFVVMTSLVLGLMLNSAKNTFQAVDDNLHSYATDLVLLDRTIRSMGPITDEVHSSLIAYIERALNDTPIIAADRTAERLLDEIGNRLRQLQPSDDQQRALWTEARQLYRELVDQRWVIVGQSDGTIPQPLVVIVIAWLILIFASFGYRSPRNTVIVTTLIVSAFLISASLCLILDMDNPSTGLIQVSDEPLQRALAEVRQ